MRGPWFLSLLKAWAISPLVLAAVLVAREAARPGRLIPVKDPQMRIDLHVDAGPAFGRGEHSSLYHITEKGWVLQSGLAQVSSLEHGARRDHDSFFLTLTSPGHGTPTIQAVRSPFFGPDTAILGPLVIGEDGARHLVTETEAPTSVILHLDGNPAYRAASIVRSIELPR
jgi:hypothetical protein